MQVKFKLIHPNAQPPKRAHRTDAGFDLYCAGTYYDHDSEQYICNSGVAFEIPEGHVGLIFPRSSICRTHLSLSNAVGVIDSGYRGAVSAVFNVTSCKRNRVLYRTGERFCQLVILPIPAVEFIETQELEDSDRGAGGYGSSGK